MDTGKTRQPSLPGDGRHGGHGGYRWVVCGLLFFATTINYVDRQVFGILGPD